MLLAARCRNTDTKHLIPAIDLGFSDCPLQAESRYDLALKSNQLYRAYDPSGSTSQAPNQKEFDLIQKLYQIELKGGAELSASYVELPATQVTNQAILHRDTANTGGSIYGGYLINKSIQVAILSVIELCELSVYDKQDAEIGETAAKMTAMDCTKLISLLSMDICKFVIKHNIGHLMEMQAVVTYVDPKKGLAYVQVQSRTKDPETSTQENCDTSGHFVH